MKTLQKTSFAVRLGGIFLGLVCLVFLPSNIPMDKDGEEVEVSGEVLDLSCYMASGAKGEGHKECAASCINNGMPIGLLGADGKVYLLIEDHKNKEPYQQLKKHAAEQVAVSGKFFEREGMPAIVIGKVQAKS
ncbi:hypothetical protein [Pleomorphovibrio marinus]|uniref:hypothetical protein n=1 Tax=Pleomorphovibrio marinus TaxID=2164132 RepID=UPI000E0BA56F|nr:hypothetical protein [Pleomorphovibrio marinus]